MDATPDSQQEPIIYTRYPSPPQELVNALAPFPVRYRDIRVGGASGQAPEVVLLISMTINLASSVTYDLLKIAIVRAWEWGRRRPWEDGEINLEEDAPATLKLYMELDENRSPRFDIHASSETVLQAALGQLPAIIAATKGDGVGLWDCDDWKYYE